MAEPFIGQIIVTPYNFAPRGYAACDGQVLSIAQNTALFSLLGITFGGNGTTTFALPDLRGRAPIHAGQGPGLSSYSLGERAGSEAVTILTANMPAHSHTLNAVSGAGNASSPSGNRLAASSARGTSNFSSAPADAVLATNTVGTAGGGQPLSTMQPYLVVNYVIALQGIFPSRN